MTREEIIEQLDSIVGTYEILLGNGVNSDILDVDDIEAIKEAISALSENKGDSISRQAVLNTLDNMDKALDEDRTVETYKALLTECIKVLPSADVRENIHGEWIKNFLGIDICSKCGEPMRDRRVNHINFCNCCGADMRGKSCSTCKNSDDEFSGECYECVKNIQNHYESQESEVSE